MAITDILTSVAEGFRHFGPFPAILCLAAIAAFSAVAWTVRDFSLAGIGQTEKVRKALLLLRRGKVDQARALAFKGRSGPDRALTLALSMRYDGRSGQNDLEREVSLFATKHLRAHRSGLRLLDAFVRPTPLLGPLSAAWSMVHVYVVLLAGGLVDASIIIDGLWIAALTTLAGLAVTIPVWAILGGLERRLERDRRAIDALAAEVLASYGAEVCKLVARPENAPLPAALDFARAA